LFNYEDDENSKNKSDGTVAREGDAEDTAVVEEQVENSVVELEAW
jgi:hypothetical protein